jgi:folate-binding protein YgfZ
MLSNEVVSLPVGASRDALLLTPKARVIATLRVLRRTRDDFLLLTEPGLGEAVRSHLARMRFAARCEIEPEEHESVVVFGEPRPGVTAIPTLDYGRPAQEVLDAGLPPTLAAEELERLRIEAGTPLFGKEIDDRVLPAEAGLDERAISFTKGCYPGQEPVARLHYRGHANRRLRRLRIEASEPPPHDAEIFHDGKAVGRVTSSASIESGVVALGYVRAEVPEDAELTVGGSSARIVQQPR